MTIHFDPHYDSIDRIAEQIRVRDALIYKLTIASMTLLTMVAVLAIMLFVVTR